MKSIKELVKELTLEEKISMIHGAEFFKTKGVKRLGIPPIVFSDGPAGVRQDFEPDAWNPIGDGSDKVSWLPSNTCIASSWDTDLAYQAGKILGEETRGRGKDMILAPGVNIKRTPLCGRNFEYMSEDPFLTASIAAPLIRGIQKSDVSACVKHFALNNQELERMSVEAVVDERTLYEIYLPAFEACTRACEDTQTMDNTPNLASHSLAVMASYNQYDNSYVCENKTLLHDILREKWGYDGIVVSDWGGVHSTVPTAENSLDIEMSVTPDFDDYYFAKPLLEAVKKGDVSESVIDEKVKRILLFMERLHMLDGKRQSGCYNTPEHQKGILEIAENSVVLLKNETNHLPLSLTGKRVAVIGDNAVRSHASGGGSSEINALFDISPLLGLKMECGDNTEILYAKGYYIDNEEKVLGEVDWQADSLAVDYSIPDNKKRFTEEILPKRKELLTEAVALAKTCDEVIFFGGLNHAYDVEGFDRPDMKLPYGQDELIEALAEANANLTVVLINGSPVEMPWKNRVHSLLQTSYNGMNGGAALAHVLVGKVNPSGHLAETYPVSLEDSPAHTLGEYPGEKTDADSHRKTNYGEGIFVGYRYFVSKEKEVAFPFGHGLSYTTFAYDNLRTGKNRLDNNTEFTFSITLKNTGKVAGKEVVQLYVGQKDAPVIRPAYELKAFQKVSVEAGEETELSLTLDAHAFAYYDVSAGCYTAKKGTYRIFIGSSSSDIRLQTEVTLDTDYPFKTLFL